MKRRFFVGSSLEHDDGELEYEMAVEVSYREVLVLLDLNEDEVAALSDAGQRRLWIDICELGLEPAEAMAHAKISPMELS